MSTRSSRNSSFSSSNPAQRQRSLSTNSNFSSTSNLQDDKIQIEYAYVLEDNQISEWLKCPICLNPFTDPILIPTCEHVFCKICIEQHIDATTKRKSGGNDDEDVQVNRMGQCPTCRAHIDTPQLKPAATLIRNMVDSLLVKCPNEPRGCMHLAERGLIGSHVRHECGWTYVDEADFYRDRLNLKESLLKQSDNPITKSARCGCGKKIMRKDWDDHIKSGNCSIERMTCPFADGEDGCGTLLKECDMDVHLEYCPARIVQCHSCSNDFRQELIIIHEEACEEVQVNCPLHPYCSWQGRRGDLGDEPTDEGEGTYHLKDCKFFPLRSFLKQNSEIVNDLQQENQRLNQRLCKMEKEQIRLAEMVSNCINVIGNDFASSFIATDLQHGSGQHDNRETGIIVPISSPRHRSGGPASPPLALRGRSGSAIDVNAVYSNSTQNANRSSHSIASAPLAARIDGEPWQWPDEAEADSQQEGMTRTIEHRQNPDQTSSATITNALRNVNAGLTALTDQVSNVERRLDDAHVVSMNAGFEAGRAHDELNSFRHGMHSIRLQMHSLLMQQQMGRNLGPVSMGSTNPTTGSPNGQSPLNPAQSPPPAGMMGLRRFWTGFEQTKL